MPRSSVADPLPIVTTLERLPQSRLDYLRNYYHDIRSNSQTTGLMMVQFNQVLMADIFRFLGTRSHRFPKCFAVCVALCKSMKIINATNWNTWGGFRSFIIMMEKAERLTRHTNMLHCPSGPHLVVAIALQQVILHDRMGENDKVSVFLRNFDSHNKAVTALYFYEMDYRQEILTLDQKWDVTPFAIQCPPNKIRNQLDSGTLNQPMSISRNQAPSEVIILDDEQVPLKRESPVAHQSPRLRHVMREEEIARPALVPVPAPMPTSIPIPMPVPVQLPAQITMPAPLLNPAPTSVLTLRPARVRETLREVSREDIMPKLQPLLDRLKSENWNGIIQKDFMEVLNDKNVRVLPSLAKGTLLMWANTNRSQNAMLLSWLEQAQDDVDVFQWTERFVESAPPAWTNPQSAHSVFHDLDAIITRMDIAKLYDQMAESKQTDRQATGEYAATEDDAAETDEEFAVHIIEANSEAERKKKKRKGEKKGREKDKKSGEAKSKKEKKTKAGESNTEKKRSHQEMELD
ncbi:hypothetical protein GGI35DRAFT_477947 [Trichoderma velutinum]